MKKIIIFMLISIFMLMNCLSVFANENFEEPYNGTATAYKSYNQGQWPHGMPSPNPYIPYKDIKGEDLGVTDLKTPTDIFVSENGYLYLLDSGNNRIIIIDKDYKEVKTIETFDNNGTQDTLKGPSGLFVNENGDIYIADTDNNRVVVIDENNKVITIIKDIKDPILPESFIFFPTKVTVDNSGRIYVVARNVFEGLMSFDPTGKFNGYFGTIKVEFSPVDMFWRLIATKEQRAKMKLFIPTEFTNADIDKDGFIYTTANITDMTKDKVNKINPSGKNVLINYSVNKVIGDFQMPLRGDYPGPSNFIDIKITDSGVYYCLDNTRNRIFAYDAEGNSVYTFGAVGNTFGKTVKPVAIEKFNNDIIVLDNDRNAILVYKETNLGSLINTGLYERFVGDETKAVSAWEQVLRLDNNYELAYRGIGKSYLSKGENKLAMKYLKKGYDRKNYSIAFRRYRNEVLKNNINNILTGLLVLVILYFSYKKFIKPSIKKRGEIK